MLNITQVFNPNGDIGNWISSTSSNFTGSDTLTLALILLILAILIMLFKMPDMLMVILLFAPIMLFTLISPAFDILMGIAIIFVGLVIWSLFPAK